MRELQEAKQLLIQQKLELQGQIEEAQKTLEQEQKAHQATRDGRQQREEQLLAHTREAQDQLVCVPVTLNDRSSVSPPPPRDSNRTLSPQRAEKKAREEQVKRGEEAEAKMATQVTALNENVATLKREVQASQRRVGELEKQTDELRGEIAVLEATVQNNQDERRALLER